MNRPVSAYLGPGWSKASPEQEAKIRIVDVLTMSSGLNTDFTYAAAPGTTFLYNTPVYAVTKRVVAAAAHEPLETLTHDWLTGPAGMAETSWRKRPAAMADIGNPTGLVTSPRDVAKFGRIVLDRGPGRGRTAHRFAGGTRRHVHALAHQSLLWATVVAERRRLRHQAARPPRRGSLDPGRAGRTPSRPWARSTASSTSRPAAS